MPSKIFLPWGLDTFSVNQKRFARQTKLLDPLQQIRFASFGGDCRWRTCEAGGLPKFPAAWDAERMNLRRLLNFAFAALVTAGLAVAPLVTPVRAGQIPATDVVNTSMPADMQCCPDQKSMDCQDCPLVAMCVLQTAQAAPPAAAVLLLRYAVQTAHIVRDDALTAGLNRPPPDQPPRSQV
jgi:hypothetical protein